MTEKSCNTCRYEHEDIAHPVCYRCNGQIGYEGTWEPKQNATDSRIADTLAFAQKRINDVADLDTQYALQSLLDIITAMRNGG